MIIVRLWGGLGNQLFQYSFGRYIEAQCGEKVAFDVSSFGKSDRLRKLEIYSIIPDFAIKNVSFAKYIGIKNRLLRFLFQCTNTYLSEKNFDISILDKAKGDIFLQGYWQHEKYARYFPIQKVLEGWKTPEILAKIENVIRLAEVSVSLHVRRGDYFSPQNVGIYGVCTERYYERAMNQVKTILGVNVQYFIFSDDISWVKEHISLPRSAIFIPNYEIPQFAYIYLMSLCKVNIISNSTYSWWGAYLNQHKDKLVIAPMQWTFNTYKTITLDSWLKI